MTSPSVLPSPSDFAVNSMMYEPFDAVTFTLSLNEREMSYFDPLKYSVNASS